MLEVLRLRARRWPTGRFAPDDSLEKAVDRFLVRFELMRKLPETGL